MSTTGKYMNRKSTSSS